MNKLSLFIIILLSLIYLLTCSKKNNIHSIDGYFEAYFPAQPFLHKSWENEVGTFVIYNYRDDYENIQYVAVYVNLREKPKDNKNFLFSFIHGFVDEIGSVIKYELIEHEGNDEILYATELERGYQLVYQFGVVAIKGNIICQWVVEEIDDMSKADKIFGEKLKNFKVLK